MRTPAFSLRPLRADDAPAVLAAFSSAPDMARQGEVSTLDEAVAFVAQLTGPASSARVFALAADDRLVGAVGLTLDDRNRTGWVWYWTHAGYRGRGWTSAAVATLADWALTAGGCERLELGHRVNNPASGRVAAAAGFVLEGRERGKFLIEDERIDVLTYGRLRTDPAPSGPRLPLVAPAEVTNDGGPPGPSLSAHTDGSLRVTVEPVSSLAAAEVLDLYDSVGWSAYTGDADSLLAGLTGSHLIVTARDGDRLVGLARAVSDGHTIVYVQDVLVRPDAQRSGVGTLLLSTLLDHYGSVRQQVLLTDDEVGQRAFYESLGFTEVHDRRPEQRAFVRLR